MKRRALTGGLGLTVLVGMLLAMGNQTATTVWADASSMSWDVYMEDTAGACPTPGGTNDGDGDIERNECPDVVSTFWLQPEGGPSGSQSFFDRANVIWTTGPLGADVTDDAIPDPTDGLTPNRPTTLGAKVGEISLEIQSNVLVAASLQNNIDDVGAMNVPQVTGQPVPCGAVDTLVLQDRFELWNAITDDSNGIVSVSDTQDPDPDYPAGCDASGGIPGAACAPKGVTMLPAPILAIEAAIGIPSGSAVSRSYGIARLPIVAGISSNIDVNLLVYSLHSMGIDGYLNVSLLQYPGLSLPDPTTPTYNPLAQTVQACPPYWTSATVYGVTAEPDFDDDWRLDLAVTPELNRLVTCPDASCGPYDYATHKSTAADYDGDTLPGYADRCDTDPNTGSADDDTDGDTLTGTCDDNEDPNCPPNQGLGCAGNLQDVAPAGWNAFPPWDTGQDVDGDTYLNYVDNCPTLADPHLEDTDGDGVGDLCDPAPAMAGDGTGYASPAPGMYLDHDNHCLDQFSIGHPEPPAEPGAPPPGAIGSEAKYCYVAETQPANYPPPYDVTPNPPLYHLGIAYNDSNDEGDPDWADLNGNAAYDVGEPIDTDDNTDNPGWTGHGPDTGDYETDACEAVNETDPLDPDSKSGSGSSLFMDCDGDTYTDFAEETHGSDPFDAGSTPADHCVFANDADCDGCYDSAEPGLTPAASSSDPWDFYDVPVPTLGSGGHISGDGSGIDNRDHAVSIINDILAVLEYSGVSRFGVPNSVPRDYDNDANTDTVPDGVAYDRSVGMRSGPPDRAVSIIVDVLLVLAQSGHSCQAPP